MADTKISALSAVTTPAATDEFGVNQAGTSKKMTLAQAKFQYVLPADFAINSTSDVTIATVTMADLVAGNQLFIDAWFTILNNSGSTRIITITLDFDALFDIELATGALATSATLLQPIHLRAVLDIRSTSLAYAMVFLDMQLLAGIASGTDTTAAATHLTAKGWGTTGSNATGSTDVTLKARSADATATQTLRLHYMTVTRAP